MIFPGFPGVLSFFQVFQVEWEPCRKKNLEHFKCGHFTHPHSNVAAFVTAISLHFQLFKQAICLLLGTRYANITKILRCKTFFLKGSLKGRLQSLVIFKIKLVRGQSYVEVVNSDLTPSIHFVQNHFLTICALRRQLSSTSKS